MADKKHSENIYEGYQQHDLLSYINLLQKTVDFLMSDFDGMCLADRGGCRTLTEHASMRVQFLRTERPRRLCVLLLGEFKSGKSTLINALTGRAVAATDVFEMTAMVCRIIPAEGQPERVILTAADSSLPDREMTLPAFIEATRELAQLGRLGQKTILSSYKQARLFLETDLIIELIDTPGLGATKENETVAMDAVPSSDVILWNLDVECLGGAREAAMVRQMQVTGQPIAFALNKADLLDDGEVDGIVAYVSKTYEMLSNAIYPVSAEGMISGAGDSGVNRLKSYLQSLAPGRAIYRERALKAQAVDTAAELVEGVEAIRISANDALADAAQNLQSMLDMAEVVTKDICGQIKIILHERLFNEIEGTLIGMISPNRARLTQADFVNALNCSVQNVDTQDFWQKLKSHVDSRFQSEWSEGIKCQLEILSRSLADARQEAKQVGAKFSEDLYAEKVHRLQRKRTAVNIAVEGGLAAATIICLHMPLVLLAAAAAPGIWALYNNKVSEETEPTMEEIEYQIRVFINAWLDDFVLDLLKDLAPELLEENRRVARVAADNYACQRHDWPGSVAALQKLVSSCDFHLDALSKVRSNDQLLLEASN